VESGGASGLQYGCDMDSEFTPVSTRTRIEVDFEHAVPPTLETRFQAHVVTMFDRCLVLRSQEVGYSSNRDSNDMQLRPDNSRFRDDDSTVETKLKLKGEDTLLTVDVLGGHAGVALVG
jgi:hypothetical protein